MKIVVCCPGSWQSTYGLDSPERGESRWSMQYAKMLARAGHDTYAASMGHCTPRNHYGVKMLNELEVAAYGPYDLYIDSSWWDTKKPMGVARKYICLKWSVEGYMREWDFPPDMYFGYPYPSHAFEWSTFKNKDKSFPLPAMFCDTMGSSKWNNNKLFLPGKIDTNREYKKYIPAVGEFLNKYPIVGGTKQFFQDEFREQIDFTRSDSHWYDKIPYNQVMDNLSTCKLSVPILNPGCIIEATVQGVPSIFWGHGGFFNPLAEALGILIQHDAPPERFTEVAELLMTNKKKYTETLMISQDYFSYHTYEGALKYFNTMVESIF